jgi:hypothetical protein
MVVRKPEKLIRQSAAIIRIARVYTSVSLAYRQYPYETASPVPPVAAANEDNRKRPRRTLQNNTTPLRRPDNWSSERLHMHVYQRQ